MARWLVAYTNTICWRTITYLSTPINRTQGLTLLGRTTPMPQGRTSRCHLLSLLDFIMVALWNRADHYIFILWFLSIYLSSFFPRLISAAAHWMSTILRHGAALVCFLLSTSSLFVLFTNNWRQSANFVLVSLLVYVFTVSAALSL